MLSSSPNAAVAGVNCVGKSHVMRRLFHLGPGSDGALAGYLAGMAHGIRRCAPEIEQGFVPVLPPACELPANSDSRRILRVRSLAPFSWAGNEVVLMESLAVSGRDRFHIQFDASPTLSLLYKRLADAAVSRGARVSMTVHRVMPDGLEWGRRLCREALELFELCDCACVHSSTVLRDVEAVRGPAHLPKVRHSEFYGDMSVFLEEEEVSRTDRHSKEDEILFFGYIHTGKGVERLVEAFEIARCQLPSAKLSIVGPCGDQALQHLLASLVSKSEGATMATAFVGTDAIPQLFRSASVIALPYERVTQSSVLAWARAVGIPAVVTDVPGFKDIWTTDRAGITVAGTSPRAFSEGLLAALAHRRNRGVTLGRAIRRASSRQSWERIAGEFISATASGG